jgi:hypothetical protein
MKNLHLYETFIVLKDIYTDETVYQYVMLTFKNTILIFDMIDNYTIVSVTIDKVYMTDKLMGTANKSLYRFGFDGLYHMSMSSSPTIYKFANFE